MGTNDRLAQSLRRVSSILRGIDESIGRSKALILVDEADAYRVPFGLRSGIGRTALFMLQEARRRAAGDPETWKRGLSPEEIKKREAKIAAGRERMAAAKKKRKTKYREKQAKEKGLEGPEREDFLKKSDLRKKPKKKSAPTKVTTKKKPAGEPRSSAPPAGAKADGGDRPAPARKADDAPKGTPKGLSPEELQKVGKRSQRGLGKRKAAPEGLRDVTGVVRRARGFKRDEPVTSPGQRRDTAHHPYDQSVEEPWRQQSPEAFRRHQGARRGDLAALERGRQERGLGRGKRGEADYSPAKLKAKASKLFRMRLKHPAHRDREHDTAKGYSPQEHPKWKGHHVDPDTGETVHSSGKKENKKFANATTFGNTDDDAMIHTDKSREGARATADDDEFVFHGDLDKDPRQKWFRVSRQGGYASAMASLRAAYDEPEKVREKVIDKVRGTGFVDDKGHQIDVRPTGSMHDERPECKVKDGELTPRGRALKERDPKEFYRLCKGTHAGPGGTKLGRIEYQSGFDPQHDNRSRLKTLHKAAQSGKAAPPHKKIAAKGQARSERREAARGQGTTTWARRHR